MNKLDMELIRRIEEVLGFKFQEWQINYLPYTELFNVKQDRLHHNLPDVIY